MKRDQIQRFSGQYFPTENVPAENFFGLNTEIYCGINIYGENFSEGEYYSYSLYREYYPADVCGEHFLSLRLPVALATRKKLWNVISLRFTTAFFKVFLKFYCK